jgi:hypothetical protein
MAYQSRPAIVIENTIRGTVKIQPQGRNRWTVIQRNCGKDKDNNQNPTWLKISNSGRKTTVHISLQWAEFRWMGTRRFGYLKQAGRYQAITGKLTPTATIFNFNVPPGESFFGAYPWYSNEDNQVFLSRAVRKIPHAKVRSIGRSADGRDILCLTIARPGGRSRKEHVVVIGREHATEPSGSFGVTGTIKYLSRGRAPAKLFKRHIFHLIPIANPDGTARGMKLTRPGPTIKRDVTWGSMVSNDPTIKAIRREIMTMRPACMIMHHCYQDPLPFLMAFEKRQVLNLLEELLSAKEQKSKWCIMQAGRDLNTLRAYCARHFGTTVVVTELPWNGPGYGRLPREIEKIGAEIFLATLKTHELKNR